MAIKIDNIEKNVEEVKDSQKRMSNKLDTFYQKATETFATKEELKKEISRLETSRNWAASNWDKIIYMMALAIIGFLYINDKI